MRCSTSLIVKMCGVVDILKCHANDLRLRVRGRPVDIKVEVLDRELFELVEFVVRPNYVLYLGAA